MIWFVLALLAAFFDASYYAAIKKYLQKIDENALAAGALLISFVILFTISLIRGIPTFNLTFILAILANAILDIISIKLYLKALKYTDLSLAMPMISFTPIFLILTSFIILRELPSYLGLLGILLIVIGSYLLNFKKGKYSLLQPLKEIWHNKGLFYMLIVAFIYSLTSVFDKVVMVNSDPYFGSALLRLIPGIFFLVLALRNKTSLPKERPVKKYTAFIVAGIITALATITINIALTMQIVPYVISLKRTSILLSVIYGGVLFKEKSMWQRLTGALIMVAGVIIILLS
ncbi:MAG: EamA family transporter [Candidatus Woesearchaeota archaeon]